VAGYSTKIIQGERENMQNAFYTTCCMPTTTGITGEAMWTALQTTGSLYGHVILIIHGGIGKNIAATAMLPLVKNAHPDCKIIVITGYPDIFLYNPHVFRVYNFANPLNVYDDYHDCSLVIAGEPYLDFGYLKKKRHLIDAFASMWNLHKSCVTSKVPHIFLLKKELESANSFLESISDKGKPVVMFQWAGGFLAPSQECQCDEKDVRKRFDIGRQRAYRRGLSIELAQKIADRLSEKYTVLCVQTPDYPKLEGTKITNIPLRGTFAVLSKVKSFIAIDSFLQHASAALNKRGLVLWGGTSPNLLGYAHNLNYWLTDQCGNSFCHRPNSYLFDSQSGYSWNCPYDEACLDFDPDVIIEKFNELEGISEN